MRFVKDVHKPRPNITLVEEILSSRVVNEECETGQINMIQSSLKKLEITDDDSDLFRMDSGHLKSPNPAD